MPSPDAIAIHNRKYLGSKKRLLGFLEQAILSEVGQIGVFFDGFSGTGVVADRFRDHAERVIANDLLYSNYVTNLAFLATPPTTARSDGFTALLEELNALPPRRGYAHEHYGGRYFTTENAGRIDACRELIHERAAAGALTPEENVLALTSLIYAADKVANTAGQYDAYLKNLGEPAYDAHGRHRVDATVYGPLRLSPPDLRDAPLAEVHNRDIAELLGRVEADVVYLDPPYNGRQYADLYHVLENIVRWEKPVLVGKTRKFDRRHLASRFSRRSTAAEALAEIVNRVRGRHLFLSYNSEGTVSPETLREILMRRGRTTVVEQDYGVFGNGAGRSVRRMVKERLFYCRL